MKNKLTHFKIVYKTFDPILRKEKYNEAILEFDYSYPKSFTYYEDVQAVSEELMEIGGIWVSDNDFILAHNIYSIHPVFNDKDKDKKDKGDTSKYSEKYSGKVKTDVPEAIPTEVIDIREPEEVSENISKISEVTDEIMRGVEKAAEKAAENWTEKVDPLNDINKTKHINHGRFLRPRGKPLRQNEQAKRNA